MNSSELLTDGWGHLARIFPGQQDLKLNTYIIECKMFLFNIILLGVRIWEIYDLWWGVQIKEDLKPYAPEVYFLPSLKEQKLIIAWNF